VTICLLNLWVMEKRKIFLEDKEGLSTDELDK
jgi:hypothetical protein